MGVCFQLHEPLCVPDKRLLSGFARISIHADAKWTVWLCIVIRQSQLQIL